LADIKSPPVDQGGDCLNKNQEKWAIFWCDLLSPILYEQIEPDKTHQFLKTLAKEPVSFPDGHIKNPSLSTLKRKLKKYRTGGFDALARKGRKDLANHARYRPK